MTYKRWLISLLSLGAILVFSEIQAQDTSTTALIVNGKSVDAAVAQVEGRSYVDIESLVRGVGGSVSFEQNRITLTIPAPTPAEAPPHPDNMSKDFQRIAVFTLAEMREWKGAISTLITSGIPVAGTWPQDYHDRVEADLMQAALTASTDPDRQALQLLQKEYTLLSEWAGKVIAEREALNAARTIDPNSLQNDQSLAKISKCGQFLSSMIVGGNFYDDSSCE
jgi:hypothetical protein